MHTYVMRIKHRRIPIIGWTSNGGNHKYIHQYYIRNNTKQIRVSSNYMLVVVMMYGKSHLF